MTGNALLLTDGLTLLDRMMQAVAQVRDRLSRTAAALEGADVPCAVLGGNAVLLWVAHHGEGGERNTLNSDLLVNRADLARAARALEGAGFCPDPVRPDLFRDGPSGSPRTRVRLLFVGEKVREGDPRTNPDLSRLERLEGFPVLALPTLVQTKLVAFRIIDWVHLRDLLDVGLTDQTWTARYPPELAARLHSLIDDPDG